MGSQRNKEWLRNLSTQSLMESLDRFHQKMGKAQTYRERRSNADLSTAIEDELERRGAIPPFSERMANIAKGDKK